MKLPPIREVRLLPVVIAATCALLLLKGLGIMTSGGYVLTGPTQVAAAGEAAEPAAPEAVEPETTLALPAEPTLSDTAPMLEDRAPTLPLRAQAAGEQGESLAEEHGAEGGATQVAETGEAAEAPGTESEAIACPPITDEAVGLDFINGREDCEAETAESEPAEEAAPEVADAVPLIKDDEGNMVPLASPSGTPESETAILERLAERRTALDAREAELDMRMALVEAAEQRIEERTAALRALEARIDAMVDEKRQLEEEQFVAVVAMYETMKPKDAAAIFDQLEMTVLLRVARAISPRKMAPIMAKMNPARAQELTAGMAVDQVEPTIDLRAEDLSALPQIVGE